MSPDTKFYKTRKFYPPQKPVFLTFLTPPGPLFLKNPHFQKFTPKRDPPGTPISGYPPRDPRFRGTPPDPRFRGPPPDRGGPPLPPGPRFPGPPHPRGGTPPTGGIPQFFVSPGSKKTVFLKHPLRGKFPDGGTPPDRGGTPHPFFSGSTPKMCNLQSSVGRGGSPGAYIYSYIYRLYI